MGYESVTWLCGAGSPLNHELVLTARSVRTEPRTTIKRSWFGLGGADGLDRRDAVDDAPLLGRVGRGEQQQREHEREHKQRGEGTACRLLRDKVQCFRSNPLNSRHKGRK